MKYEELEKLYTFSKENNLDVVKHNIITPSREDIEALVEKYKITTGAEVETQVLDDMITVSRVTTIGGVTLFENILNSYDQFKIQYYEEDN